jgi:hypothetical protein
VLLQMPTNATNQLLFIVKGKQTYIMLQSSHDLDATTKPPCVLDIANNYQQ